ncbi:MAG: signal recognition particle-docking protein FtsY [Gammaproteobacteria bacterium]|nr:signal recognition particle-docking protein FtsY [Gammaproteobacteria bacterium]
MVKIREVTKTNKRPNSWSRLGKALANTRARVSKGIANVFSSGQEIDEHLLEELEFSLLSADIGASTTTLILDQLRRDISKLKLSSREQFVGALESVLLDLANKLLKPFSVSDSRPFVVLVTGVNGVGKTTTIGKLAYRFKGENLSVMLAAGDTYRAAAIDQLKRWGQTNDIPVFAQQTGSDSASVAHDAFQVAKSRNIDVLIVDTAGRLHSNKGLMDELAKVHRVIQRLDPSAPHESILVLDGTIGQNALMQVEQFDCAVDLSGLVMTKLDGTAKGGVVLALPSVTSLPLYFVGLGESVDALQPFEPQEYVSGLLDS